MRDEQRRHQLLGNAEAPRDARARQLDPGAWVFVALAVAIAVHMALVAIGLAEERPLTIAAGLVVFLATAAVLLRFMHRGAGVRGGAFASRVVLGTDARASGWYVIGLGSSCWAALESQWWLLALCAAIGGVGYSRAGRRWLREHHERPHEHARTASALQFALAMGVAGVALALLLLNR